MILEEGVELTLLRFGKYLQVWKVHLFLYLYLEWSHFQTGILLSSALFLRVKQKGFFFVLNLKGQIFKSTLHKLHTEHLAVSFPTLLAVLRLI